MPSKPTALPICRIWTNAALPDAAMNALRVGVSPHELCVASDANQSVLAAGTPNDECRAADIILGQPDPSDLLASSALRWVQLTSAGYTRYDTDALRHALAARGAVATNSSSVYNEPCAEHVLAMMLGFARQSPRAAVDQLQKRWDQMPIRAASRLLTGDTVLIVGLGAIGKRVAELLAPFRKHITAFRRSPRGDEGVPTLPIAQIDELLPTADHVINILPSSKATTMFFDEARLKRIKPGAFFYNIGRGDTVDQTALCAALTIGRLSGAYLDVTTPEPLPPSDPLWTAPNCHITPHVAGGHATEFDRHVKHFLANLERLTAAQPLVDRILQ